MLMLTFTNDKINNTLECLSRTLALLSRSMLTGKTTIYLNRNGALEEWTRAEVTAAGVLSGHCQFVSFLQEYAFQLGYLCTTSSPHIAHSNSGYKTILEQKSTSWETKDRTKHLRKNSGWTWHVENSFSLDSSICHCWPGRCTGKPFISKPICVTACHWGPSLGCILEVSPVGRVSEDHKPEMLCFLVSDPRRTSEASTQNLTRGLI